MTSSAPAADQASAAQASRRIVTALLRWFDHHARDLPWRRTRDPYAIWISEVMLQQTRVDTVVPYYRRFLRDFPSLTALARAGIDDVLRCWSGLGYYRRARALHLCAREVVERYGGELPATTGELAELSGIGEYTAGAIASIAFDEQAAVVDGNVGRVLARVFAIGDDLRSARGKRRVWRIARELVPVVQPGRFNQALMELGRTICTPHKPACSACPLRRDCQAHRYGRTAELPRLLSRKAPKPERFATVVVSCKQELLFAQRNDRGLFAGLWEPPLVGRNEATRRGGALAALGLSKDGAHAAIERCDTVRHVLSHRILLIDVRRATAARRWRLPPAADPYQRLQWRTPSELALSTLAKKLLRAAGVVQQET